MVSPVPPLLRIASRGSQLALWQAEFIAAELRRAHPELTVEIEIIKTIGDRILDVPRIGDRGLFTKEVDEALLDRRADIAVHSLKDVPTTITKGLHLAAIGRREDPRDVLVGPAGADVSIRTLPAGARVGTSSLRRRAQLHHARPDLEVVDLRGNLNTRLAKLDAGDYDAIILAAAGVLRLGWEDRVSAYLDTDEWLPAVGQGALAIVARNDDEVTRRAIECLDDAESAVCVRAERAFLRELEGGCQVPIAALARVWEGRISMEGLVSSLDGRRVLREHDYGSLKDPETLGVRLATRMEGKGALDILRAIRGGADGSDHLTV